VTPSDAVIDLVNAQLRSCDDELHALVGQLAAMGACNEAQTVWMMFDVVALRRAKLVARLELVMRIAST
jgi:hypothetical protein